MRRIISLPPAVLDSACPRSGVRSRDTFEVKQLCQAVEINRSSYYAWEAAADGRAQRDAADAALAERIKPFHDADKTYGAPRITADLNDAKPVEERVNHKRVARVMRKHKIAGVKLRRRVRTTVPEPSEQKVPDLVKRDFTAPAPNTKYVGVKHPRFDAAPV
jgi:hypothetical protein